MADDLDLAALDELVAAASAGPLAARTVSDRNDGVHRVTYAVVERTEDSDLVGEMESLADATAYVALRNAYPALRALIDQRAAELERLRRVEWAARAFLCSMTVADGSTGTTRGVWCAGRVDHAGLALELRAALRGEEDGR